ncbi:MAG TPA: NADH-quinone oxidoreductase subunit NuoE [Candidatus Dormibacteraeota bacterium]|nr:NADH-quinone oxidoreductase subunit NuoE [Candidatus Dormibacteraeota bacterium]
MSALSTHVLEEIRALPPQFPDIRTAVMPALDLAQEELGYLTPEAMSEVAHALDLDPGYVEGVATFYTLFHTEPVGKHVLYMCTNISCKLRGADELLEHAMQQAGLKEQGTVSADGLFTVEAVECLGACEYAPMMRLDHAYHYDLTTERIDALIAERRSSPRSGEVAPKAPEGSAPTPRKRATKKKADA